MGPFSSTQLTVIVVTLIIVVAFPFAAFAVSGSNAFVTDPTTGTHAKVDMRGSLHTALDGGTVSVSGAVTATPTPPASAYIHSFATNKGGCAAIAAPPGRMALVIMSVKEEAFPNSGGGSTYSTLQPSSLPGKCKGPVLDATHLTATPTTSERTAIAFPSGLPIKAKHSLDVYVLADTGRAGMEYTVDGYLVPAAQCTTGCY